jgi:hypothetical protein
VRTSRRHRPDPAQAHLAAGERRCSRNGCQDPAIATLTYVYAASTAVVGPLAAYPEPHAYDLCKAHAHGLTAPRGWQLVRHDGALVPPPPPPDDLAALAEAIWDGPEPPVPGGRPPRPRGHLRVVPGPTRPPGA